MLPPGARAGAPPDRPRQAIRLVLPWAAGGTGDALALPLAASLSRQLGRSVVLDHRPGLHGGLAAEIVAGSRPDGHTFLLASSEQLTALLVQPRQPPESGRTAPPAPHDLQRDLAPVTLVALAPSVLVTANRPASAASFSALRGQPSASDAAGSARSYASTGNGSPSHLAAEHVRLVTGMAAAHRPYANLQAALADLRTAKVDFMVLPLTAALPGIRDGGLRALAVTGGSRTFALPAVPTLAESGTPDLRLHDWQALWSPPATPPDIRSAMQTAVAAALDQKELVDVCNGMGAERGGQPARVLELLVRSESLKWARTLEALGPGLQ